MSIEKGQNMHLKKIFFIYTLLCIELCGCGCNHSWTEATCNNPKTCELCGETEGKALGHITDEWTEWDEDYDDALYIKEKICSRCKDVTNSESKEIISFVENGCFTIHPYAFANRFDTQSERLNGVKFESIVEYKYGDDMMYYNVDDNTIYYRIKENNRDIGMYIFYNSSEKALTRQNDFSENEISKIDILVEDSYDLAPVIYTTLLTIDPSIDYSYAAELGQTIQDNLVTAVNKHEENAFSGIDYNGINYLVYRDNDYYYLIVTPSENWEITEIKETSIEDVEKNSKFDASNVESEIYELGGLVCRLPKDWEIYVNDTVIKASTGKQEAYHSWYISYKKGCSTIQEYLEKDASESFSSEFYSKYDKTVIKGCDEAYSQFEKDESCCSIDYYVTHENKVYQLQYFAYNEVYNENEVAEFLSRIEFK